MIAVDVTEAGLDCDICQCVNGSQPGGWRIADIGFRSDFCPRQQVSAFSWYALQLFAHYERGLLPYPGGIAAQPRKIMLAFQVIAERRAHNAKAKHSGTQTRR